MAAHDKARTGAKLGFAALLACLTAPALAQTIPLPTPRPPVSQTQGWRTSIFCSSRQAGGSEPGTRCAGTSAAALRHRTTQSLTPLLPCSARQMAPASLPPNNGTIVERVNSYLSGVQTLTGNFVQVGPDGNRTQGDFYIYKPGRVRFEYDNPSPIELIADGSSVVVRDRRLGNAGCLSAVTTPLRFLLAERVDLTKDTNLVSVYADDVFVTVVLEEKNGVVGTSRLMIMFSAKDMQLKQWTVTDPQGYDTTVAVYNLDTSKRPDPALFKIDYTRYHN
jgi:outer membrane lipoprotein-sorting protein